ncbi:MAG: FHA domain-containing protein [Pseudoclavibacter sp.]|nr:FHA domain-containing protein [Pseudoclavibacter sp.]
MSALADVLADGGDHSVAVVGTTSSATTFFLRGSSVRLRLETPQGDITSLPPLADGWSGGANTNATGWCVEITDAHQPDADAFLLHEGSAPAATMWWGRLERFEEAPAEPEKEKPTAADSSETDASGLLESVPPEAEAQPEAASAPEPEAEPRPAPEPPARAHDTDLSGTGAPDTERPLSSPPAGDGASSPRTPDPSPQQEPDPAATPAVREALIAGEPITEDLDATIHEAPLGAPFPSPLGGDGAARGTGAFPPAPEGSPAPGQEEDLDATIHDEPAPQPAAPSPSPQAAPPQAAPQAAAEAFVPQLLSNQGHIVPLNRTIVVGRRPSASRAPDPSTAQLLQLSSPNEEISRSHCAVSFDAGNVLVWDLDSANGTTVLRSGAFPEVLSPMRPVALGRNDVVDLGDGALLRIG